jgi:hypothetical protein
MALMRPVAVQPAPAVEPMVEPTVVVTAAPPPVNMFSEDPDELVVDRPSDQVELDMLVPDAAVPEAEVLTMVTEQCANTAVTSVDVTTIRPADIIFAIDTSSSMGEETEFVQTYLNQFSQQIIDSGIDVRVILIGNYQAGAVVAQPASELLPDGGVAPATAPVQDPRAGGGGRQNFGLCIAAPLGSGACPQDENLPIYAHVGESVGSNDMLNVIVNSFPQWQQHLRPEASKSIVIVSDDDALTEPNNSAAAFTAALEGLAPELFTEWTFNGIFCGMDCEPDSVRIGVVYQELVAQTGGVAGELCLQDFQPVFDRLAEQIIDDAGTEIACEWELPAVPEGQTFSVDLVEVNRTTDIAGTVAFSRVPYVEDCAASSWYFDDPLNPTRILACPQTCEAMQAEAAGSIDVSFGCELIAGCADTSGSAIVQGDDGASCAFPLPEPPEGVLLTVSTVNVRYETPSGFGVVLGIVPTADECANVGGGWHFDDPEEPTTITLCPATCDEYEAGVVTNVQALFGCEQKPADPLTGVR